MAMNPKASTPWFASSNFVGSTAGTRHGLLPLYLPHLQPHGLCRSHPTLAEGQRSQPRVRRNSAEPEVRLLQSELVAHAFASIISLHTDDTSRGFYGFAHGATLTRHLIEPDLEAAAEFLPRNPNPAIDGFPARNGIIRQACPGVLSAPPKMRPRPFQITLETPFAPNFFKEAALVAALRTILIRYRELMAYAPNLQFQVCCPPKPSCQFVSIRVSLSSVFRPLSSVLCPPSSAPAPPPAKCSPRGRGHSAFRIRANSTLRPVPKVLCCPP